MGCPCSQVCARRKINNKQLRLLRTSYPWAGEMAQPERRSLPSLMASVWSLGLRVEEKIRKVVLWPPRVHDGTRMPSYTRAHTHTQTTVTYKRTLCPREQVIEVPTGETGSRKISPGEKAQSLAELQLSASTSAANSRWGHGSLTFDVSLVCALNWITPVASVGCWNFLV